MPCGDYGTDLRKPPHPIYPLLNRFFDQVFDARRVTLMRLCDICGNEISDTDWKCPFCETTQSGQSFSSPAKNKRPTPKGIRTINLKSNRPTAAEGIQQLEREISSAQYQRIKIVRIIHGWGSSGTGGTLKTASHRALRSMQAKHLIKTFLSGDDYSEATQAGQALMRRHPALKNSLRTDRNNPGITFVEL